jgi:hypothetical protein
MRSIFGEKWQNATGDLTPPPGYVYVAAEGEAKTFDSPTNVAYGANGHFAYLANVQGTILFSPSTFGTDPARNVIKGGFAEVTVANQTAAANLAAQQAAATGKKWLIYGGIGVGLIISIIVIIKVIKKKK